MVLQCKCLPKIRNIMTNTLSSSKSCQNEQSIKQKIGPIVDHVHVDTSGTQLSCRSTIFAVLFKSELIAGPINTETTAGKINITSSSQA